MPEITGDDEGGYILNKILEGVADIFFPRRCAVCDRVLSVNIRDICKVCEKKLVYTGQQYCLKCGRKVTDEEEYCAICKKQEKTAYDSGRVVFVYNASMRESISRFKYHGRKEYAAFYAKQMEKECRDWIRQIAPDVLIPVPIHRERQRARGYNQAEIVAQKLGESMGILVWNDFLLRTKNTLPQKGLSRKERMKNVGQAFSIGETAQKLYKVPNCVILIDDIYTTGSTIEACAEALRREGVRRIFFLCISAGQQM